MQEQMEKYGRKPAAIDPKVMNLLESYSWPGNVRELENLAQRIVALQPGDRIIPEDLPEQINNSGGRPVIDPGLPDGGVNMEEWIDELILKALEKNNWNQSRTAKFLNVSRNTLVYRMEKRGLKGHK